MTDNIELLMSFGLTRQEAKIYILLLTEGALSGYEAAKRIGISRSNVYGALAGLVEKGAAFVVEEQAVQYEAVDIKEFCDNKLRYMKEMAEVLKKQIPESHKVSENYITIRGRRHVEDKFRNMLVETKERIYLSVSSEVIERFHDELEKLIERGCKVVLVTQEPYVLSGALHYYTNHVRPKGIGQGSQIRLIADSRYALTGEITDEEESNCLYSSNQNLVILLKEALANEIKLIRLNQKQDV